MDDPGVGANLSPDVDEPLLDEVRVGFPEVRRGASRGVVDPRVVGELQGDAFVFHSWGMQDRPMIKGKQCDLGGHRGRLVTFLKSVVELCPVSWLVVNAPLGDDLDVVVCEFDESEPGLQTRQQ